MDDGRLLQQFVAEAEELADTLRRDLESLAGQAASGRVEPSLLNRVFRSAHSVKGMAGMAGAMTVARAAHRFEDLLDDLRMGRVAPDPAVVAGCARIADELGDMIARVARGASTEAEAARIEAAVDELLRGAAAADAVDLASFVDLDERVRATLTEYEEHRLRENVRERRPIYEARVSFGLAEFSDGFRSASEALAAAGEVLGTLPGAAPDDPTRIAFRIVVASSAPAEELAAIVAPAGGEIVEISRYPKAGPSAEPADEPEPRVASSIRVEVAALDAVASLAESLALRAADLASSCDSMAERLGLGPRDRFDLRREARAIERGFDELEELVVEMRLVPLGPTFARARRRVASIAAGLGREVECIVEGEGVRLDKAIVDALAEPLAHLITNAVDHGVETPAERIAAGKTSAGRVTLRAEQRGNRVAISVADDGRGVDAGALARAAARLGLGVEGIAAAFLPGVTTADEVSDMSGRGVGLDAVAAAVGALGGHVDLTTASGRGTTFTVTLPTTLVVASVFLVQTRGAVYAIDVNQVSEVGVLAPGGVMLGADGPSVEWRGERIPFYRLAALTRATGEVWEPSSALPCVVAHIGDQLAAVAVDGLVGEREVVLKPLGRHARMLVGVSGAVELDGGRIALLVDLQTLAAERRRASAAGAQEA